MTLCQKLRLKEAPHNYNSEGDSVMTNKNEYFQIKGRDKALADFCGFPFNARQKQRIQSQHK